MGVHEANQEAGGDWTSPGKYFYRVHMKVELDEGEPGEANMNRVLTWLRTAHEGGTSEERQAAWGALREELMGRVQSTTNNQKALALLDTVLQDYPEDTR
jgi:hypothetical protein